MKILLLGKNGQVGWELQRSLAPIGELLLPDRSGPADFCGDLERTDDLRTTVSALRPDAIINAGAYTAVDGAESDAARARALNAHAAATLAQLAAESGAWLVHYSTDYVFDGSGQQPWREDDPTSPINEYGRSKLEGEAAIRATGCRHLILRTSWVFAARGKNFARTMLRLAEEREELAVIDDQHGAPTGAELLADVTAHALLRARHAPGLAGTYHVTASGETTWHGYAQHVIDRARGQGRILRVAPGNVKAVSTQAYPTPARRPLNSRLCTRKFRDAFGLELPSWQFGVDRAVDELLGA